MYHNPTESREDLTANALGTELCQVVEEIEQHRRGADAEALEHAHMTRAAYRELGLPSASSSSDGVRARIEMLERDVHALGRRFDRWFPAPAEDAAPAEDPGADRADLELLVLLLSSLVEVIEITSSDPIARRADAIEVFERLLTDAGITPWRASELATRHAREVAPPLRALRALVDTSRTRTTS